MNAPLQIQKQASTTAVAGPVKPAFLQRKCACGGSSASTGACAGCDEKKLSLQRSASISDRGPSTSESVPGIVHEVLRSPGRPLDSAMRAFMEPRFGHDFGHVRVHTDASAAESARAVNAAAYTVGRNVVFDTGRYEPGTRSGRELIAHELTHTIQQSGTSDPTVSEISDADDISEQQASQAAKRIMSSPASQQESSNESHGPNAHVQNSLGRSVVQRHKVENDPSTAPTMICSLPASSVADYLLTVPFPEGDSTIGPVDKMILADFATEWNLSSIQPMVRIDGFASAKGKPAKNWPLSCDRAFAVASELNGPSVGGKPGIPSTSLEFFANGETDRFSTSLTPNQVAGIHAPGIPLPASREPSVHDWTPNNSAGATNPLNCCVKCPVNLGVDCDPSHFRNGIELKVSIRDHDPAYSYDIKRTLEAKYHRAEELTGPWETVTAWNRPAGTPDDTHDDDECLTPQANGSVHDLYSEDRPGFFTSNLDNAYNKYVVMVNFIEFVRIQRSDGSTYDDPFQQNWHTKTVVEKTGGTWSVNTADSEIDVGHLGSLDP